MLIILNSTITVLLALLESPLELHSEIEMNARLWSSTGHTGATYFYTVFSCITVLMDHYFDRFHITGSLLSTGKHLEQC